MSDDRVFQVDLKVYSLDAVKRTVHALGKEACFSVSIGGQDLVKVAWIPADTCGADEVEKRFWRELMEQELRCRVTKETAAIHTAIIQQAFSPIAKRK